MREPDGTFSPGHNMKRTHGLRGTKAYSVYRNMRTRCENPNCKFFPYYGGRGIGVCAQWKTFAGFHADMGDPPEGLTLDRIDNDKGYFPENCRWATRKEQSRNRRNRRDITLDGVARSITEWAEISGIPESTLRFRINKGWHPREAVFRPVLPIGHKRSSAEWSGPEDMPERRSI